MREIEIRFIEHKSTNTYYIQYHASRLFGGKKWEYIGENRGAGFGDYVWCEYYAKTKEELIEKVLNFYFKLPKAQVTFLEHPTLLMY